MLAGKIEGSSATSQSFTSEFVELEAAKAHRTRFTATHNCALWLEARNSQKRQPSNQINQRSLMQIANWIKIDIDDNNLLAQPDSTSTF